MADRSSSKRLDVTIPAVRDALQRLLDHPDVAEVLLCKALRPEDPVSVGVRHGPRLLMSWSYASTGFQAVTQAEQALKPRKLVGDGRP